MINLLSNAVKFTSNSGSIYVDIRKVVSDENGVTKIKFEVQDSGIGVTSEQKASIFDAFSQADTSITRKYGGTGLGLTISSRFVELMGGKLDIHSEVGEGTTFFFTLDFEEVATLSETSKGIYSSINALLFEPEEKDRRKRTYLHEYLEYYGIHYQVFTSMDELQRLEKESLYHLLIVDYDDVEEAELRAYSNLAQKLIVLTKAYNMKKIESMKLDIFKTVYEPLNNSKIKQVLENYNSESVKMNKINTTQAKEFDENISKFRANVLVAEDNVINQKLIKRTLEDLGLSITIAADGVEAFEKCQDGDFDLIFMDIQMPRMDGVQASKKIVEYEKKYNRVHVPIIALTANALQGDRERFLAAGLDEFTTKPLVRAEIISHLNHFLANHIEAIEAQEIKTVSSSYTADILLVKKSGFEAKLFEKILDSLGMKYNFAKSANELEILLKEGVYKVIFFEKESLGMSLKAFSELVKKRSKSKNLETSLVLIKEPFVDEELGDTDYINESMENIVSKNSLELVIKKFI